MRHLYFTLCLILLFGCGSSSNDSNIELPVAVNDTATTQENMSVTISVLDNDTLVNSASLSDYESLSDNNGTITESQNRLTYTPAENFTGTDTFTYTICDIFSTPNCSTATVTVTVTDEGTAVAVDDTYEVEENSTLIIRDLLSNDTIVDGAELTSIDNTSSVGTVILNNDGTVSYSAPNAFVGSDTFSYTICDNDATPTCATGIVNITVVDEGNPTANDDTVYIEKNSSTFLIDAFLDNDSLLDDAILESIDNSMSQGEVVFNSDGSVSYTPNTDFVGEDSFTYTICDDDTPNASCNDATVTIVVYEVLAFNIPSDILAYYEGTVFFSDSDLLDEEIESLITNTHSVLTYTERHNYLYDIDEDISNTDNVILMYTSESRYWEEYTSGSNSYSPQTFNTEHVYPQSLYSAADAEGDLHHLRVCDADVNTERSNNPFGEGSGEAVLSNGEWYPGDEWRGDVARMIMYLNVRYGESFNDVGSLELFLQWNIDDPVSDFEIQRNNGIEDAQGNRNPFIDNPYLATLIWGGDAAENRWE